MTDSLTITVLIENRTDRADIVPEHGLAVWLGYGDKHILFDTGRQ